jgi:hypothetical protein
MIKLGGVVSIATGICLCALLHSDAPAAYNFFRLISAVFGIAAVLVGAMLLSIKD